MIDAQKQSEIIAAKANEVYESFATRLMTVNCELDPKKEMKDAIHGAVASGYLLCLQHINSVAETMQTAPEIKDELNSHENVRGM